MKNQMAGFLWASDTCWVGHVVTSGLQKFYFFIEPVKQISYLKSLQNTHIKTFLYPFWNKVPSLKNANHKICIFVDSFYNAIMAGYVGEPKVNPNLA